MKSVAFWALDATVLFALSMVYLHQGYQRKNPLFALWLCNGVAGELIAAWALAAGPPVWINSVRVVEDAITYAVTIGVLVLAAMRRDCPVNRTLLWGVGAMLALNILSRILGVRVEHAVQVWLRNIAFFGPAIFLLIALSGLRFDLLPLWISTSLRIIGGRCLEGPALAAAGIFGMRRGPRQPE